MARNRKNNNASKSIGSISRTSSGDVNPDFENHLNRILRNYKNQGKILNKINQIRQNSNSLTNKLTTEQQKILNKTLKRYEIEANIRKNIINTSNIYKGIMGSLSYIYNYLEQNDDTIKSSAINLGLSRSLSDQYRENLLASSQYAARLGLSLKELSKIQEAYTAETGQSALLSGKALESISLITQGTGLSAENAGTLVGQFKLLGLNAENTKDFVELTAKETGKLGLNLNKVLSEISSNFKTIQSFNFSNGINGVQKMAMYANMYKINMQDAFASMEKSRTLEGAVEMSAKLMVMGGEFSKQNMFELGFLARNRPEEFIKKLNEMNRSVYHFNASTGELQSSAFDLDRLRAVADATGVPFEQLNQQARRIAEIDFAKTKITGNLSKDEKDFIANMAQFNKATGKFEIELGRDTLDIRNIGREQLMALREQKDSLEQRALDSQTFDKAFRASIEELKTIALPLIINLNDFLRRFQEYSAAAKIGIIGLSGVLVSGLAKGTSLLVTGIGGTFAKFLAGLKVSMSMPSIGGGIGKGLLSGLGGIGTALSSAIPGLLTLSLVLGSVGLAAMGVGKGIEFATTGLSKLFSSLTPEVAQSINDIGWGFGKIGLGLATFGNPLTIAGIGAFSLFLGALSFNKNNLNNLSDLAVAMANGTQGFIAFGDVMDKVRMVNNDKTIDKLRNLVSELNNIQISNPINELKELLSKPLKVEFADNNVDMVVNISNIMDGKILSKNIYPHIVKLTKNNSENR